MSSVLVVFARTMSIINAKAANALSATAVAVVVNTMSTAMTAGASSLTISPHNPYSTQSKQQLLLVDAKLQLYDLSS